jgi:excisionase family DNA binding protein
MNPKPYDQSTPTARQLVGNEAMSKAPGEFFEPFLNSTEAAALLKIHPKTLQKMARYGSLPALRIGDLWRFRASELDVWARTQLSSDSHSCRNSRKDQIRCLRAHVSKMVV